jgi:hypothetical protein
MPYSSDSALNRARSSRESQQLDIVNNFGDSLKRIGLGTFIVKSEEGNPKVPFERPSGRSNYGITFNDNSVMWSLCSNINWEFISRGYDELADISNPYITFLSKPKFHNKGSKIHYTVNETIILLSSLMSKAEQVLREHKISVDEAARLVFLTTAWQSPKLAGRGKYDLETQLKYIRQSMSFEDIRFKERFDLSFDEWEECKDIPLSFLEKIHEGTK